MEAADNHGSFLYKSFLDSTWILTLLYDVAIEYIKGDYSFNGTGLVTTIIIMSTNYWLLLRYIDIERLITFYIFYSHIIQ